MKVRESFTCPLEVVHDFVRGKWKTILIFQMRHGTQTFSELKHGIKGISEKMLIQQLRELIEFGIIDKICGEGYPLHTEYFLTDRGIKVLSAVEIMQEVGIEYMLEHGKKTILEEKGIDCSKAVLTKK